MWEDKINIYKINVWEKWTRGIVQPETIRIKDEFAEIVRVDIVLGLFPQRSHQTFVICTACLCAFQNQMVSLFFVCVCVVFLPPPSPRFCIRWGLASFDQY